MQQLVIVEDEEKIADTVRAYLEREGFSVQWARNAATAYQLINAQTDLVVLDLMLPDGRGEDICENITREYNTPVIMLTSRSSEQARINGFACGADDYLCKPFSPRELVARVKSILKRARPQSDALNLSDRLVITPQCQGVTYCGSDIALTRDEFSLFHYLCQHPDRAFTREQLALRIGAAECVDRLIDVHIHHIRQKFASPKIVKTVYGIGYQLGEV